MTLIPSLVVSALTLGLFVRYLYLIYMRTCWQEACAIYVAEVNETPHHLVRYMEVWPLFTMLMHLQTWDFSRFIVDQESMDRILLYYRDKIATNR